MKDQIDKFVEVERSISSEKGEFALFALMLREEAQNKWDLLISAPWLKSDKKEALRYVAEKVREEFKEEELLNLSRIVIIEEDNPALEAFQKAIGVQHGHAEVKDSMFFGLEIKHAFIVTSQRPNENASGRVRTE